MNPLSKTLIIAGAVLIAAGVLTSLSPKLGFLGRLPGNIRIEREHFRFYFPVASSLLLSAALSFIIWFIRHK